MSEETPTLSSSASEGIKERRRSLPIAVGAAVILVAGVLSAVYWLNPGREPSPPSPPSQEDLAYADQVQLSELHLSAEENFLGQQVVYLDGKITNQGAKTVQRLRVRLFFRDYLNQVVLKEEQEILGARPAPLPPGQTRSFQLRFDRLPDSWNRQVPQFQLVSIQVQ